MLEKHFISRIAHNFSLLFNPWPKVFLLSNVPIRMRITIVIYDTFSLSLSIYLCFANKFHILKLFLAKTDNANERHTKNAHIYAPLSKTTNNFYLLDGILDIKIGIMKQFFGMEKQKIQFNSISFTLNTFCVCACVCWF